MTPTVTRHVCFYQRILIFCVLDSERKREQRRVSVLMQLRGILSVCMFVPTLRQLDKCFSAI